MKLWQISFLITIILIIGLGIRFTINESDFKDWNSLAPWERVSHVQYGTFNGERVPTSWRVSHDWVCSILEMLIIGFACITIFMLFVEDDKCPECAGEGQITLSKHHPSGLMTNEIEQPITCKKCGGTGKIKEVVQ